MWISVTADVAPPRIEIVRTGAYHTLMTPDEEWVRVRSRHADLFNHDADAGTYDENVRESDNPIRAGYDAVLDWVARRVTPAAGGPVVDLGIGTGNLTLRLPEKTPVIGVDVSERMLAIAERKLAGRPVTFVRADVLEFFEDPPPFGALMSTYTLHHLEPDERLRFFELLSHRLGEGDRAVFGDLMFESAPERDRLVDAYHRAGQESLVADIHEEFFWDVETDRRRLEDVGFDVDVIRFSELSWGIAATKRR